MMTCKRVAVLVAVCVCLAAPALGSDWNVANGLWSNPGSWSPAAVPNGTNATIDNFGTATLQSVVPTITALEISNSSELHINLGANLTTTGNASIGSGGLGDEGFVTQAGGIVSVGSNLTLGGAVFGFAEWTMASDSSLGISNDLTVGGIGAALFEVEDDSVLAVGGNIDIGKLTGGAGTLAVSGAGTLTHTGGSLNVGVLGAGGFGVAGDAPTINVTDYVQGGTGGLNLVLNDFGIAPINISGDMMLNGGLNVSVASGASPAAGIYDILIAEGTRTGIFNSVHLPENVELRYEEEGTTSVARLYVGQEAPVLPGAEDSAISVNTDWTAMPLGNGDIAGVQAAANWNNVNVSAGVAVAGGREVTVAGLAENSGAATSVGMKLSGSAPNSSELNDGGALPDYKMMDNGPRSFLNDPGQADYMQMELTGLATQFPTGYDVILYFGTGYNANDYNAMGGWGVTVVSAPGSYSGDMNVTPLAGQYIQVPQVVPNGASIISTHGWSDNKNDGAPYNFANVYRESLGTSAPGNYQVISGQSMDTLTLTFAPRVDSSHGVYPNQSNDSFDTYALLGFQVVASVAEPMEMIVDNLDAPLFSYVLAGGLGINDSVDAWQTKTSGYGGLKGHTGSSCTWATPGLPFEGVDEYELYTWVAHEKPAGGFYDLDPNAMYTIEHAFGTDVLYIDQNTAPGSWLFLGTYSFTGTLSGDGSEYVRITSQAATAWTSYDAVMWRKVPAQSAAEPVVPEPAGLGLIGLALLAVRKRHS